MDLRTTETIWLATRTPRELMALLREQTQWDVDAVQNIDGAMAIMVSNALNRTSPDLDELSQFQSLLRAAKRHVSDKLPEQTDYLARWNMLADCLRISAEAINDSSYDAVKHMLHVDNIIDLLRANDGLTQSELQTKLDLQPANLTRILNTLENHRVIVRERQGKEKRVKLGVNAPQAQPALNCGSNLLFKRTGTHS